VPTQVLTGFGTADEAEKAGIEPPYYLDEKRFALLHTSIVETRQDTAAQGKPAATPTPAKKEEAGDLLKQAGSLVEATDLILESLIVKVAKHLERDEADIDPEEPLYTYGVDSLVAIEIKNWIMKEFASDVALLDITAEEPVFELAERIAVKSKFVSVAA
jgi:zearalenone synthase (highly reducing iterative type I polyketide synthase)